MKPGAPQVLLSEPICADQEATVVQSLAPLPVRCQPHPLEMFFASQPTPTSVLDLSIVEPDPRVWTGQR